MTKIRFLLTLLFTIFIAAGCGSPVEEKKPVRISINVWPGYAHAFIAEKKGFFVKNNVRVELLLKENYSEAIELYKNDEVDGVFNVFLDSVVLNSSGMPTKLVYISDYSIYGDIIIGRQEFESLSDLRDRTVSFEGINSFSHFFVLKLLEMNGLRENDVKFKNVNALDVLSSLEKGEIDAGHTWEPVKTRALERGYKILGKAGDIPGIITDGLSFNSKIIEERPEDIKRIVKSLLEARDFVFSNRNEAMEIMAEAEGISIKEIEEGIDGIYMLNLKENMEALEFSGSEKSVIRTAKAITEFLINRGQLPQKPDFDKVLEPRFVKSL